jgi:hypothetical protein
MPIAERKGRMALEGAAAGAFSLVPDALGRS